MKKIWFPLFCIVLFFAVVSCEKYEDEMIPETTEVRIYMSSTDSNLKSTSSLTRTQISNGDTVDLMNVQGINIIFSAEDQGGFHLQGKWSIVFIENDITLNNPGLVLLGTEYSHAESPMLSRKFDRLGLYRATFEISSSERVSFLVRHFGLPGMLGDKLGKGAAFRLAKDMFQIDNYQTTSGYTAFIKFNEFYESMWSNIDVDYELFQALISSSNYTFTSKSGFLHYAKNVQLKRCKYAMGYLSVTVIEDDIKPYNDTFRITFYYGSYGENWRVIPSVYESEWKLPEGIEIVFKTI